MSKKKADRRRPRPAAIRRRREGKKAVVLKTTGQFRHLQNDQLSAATQPVVQIVGHHRIAFISQETWEAHCEYERLKMERAKAIEQWEHTFLKGAPSAPSHSVALEMRIAF